MESSSQPVKKKPSKNSLIKVISDPGWLRKWGCLIVVILIFVAYCISVYVLPELMEVLRGVVPFPVAGIWLLICCVLLAIPYFLKADVSRLDNGEIHLSSPYWSDVSKGVGMIMIGFPVGILFIYPAETTTGYLPQLLNPILNTTGLENLGKDWFGRFLYFMLTMFYFIGMADSIIRLKKDLNDKMVIGNDHIIIDKGLGNEQLRLEKAEISAIVLHTSRDSSSPTEYLTFNYQKAGNGDPITHQMEPREDLNVSRAVIVSCLKEKGYPVKKGSGE